MEKYHLRKFIFLPIIAILTSCCIQKNATQTSYSNLFFDKSNKNNIISNLQKDSILLAIQNVDSLYLYSIAGPQQPKDTIDCDSIEHYKIAKNFGKVSFTHTSIYNFLIAEDEVFNQKYPLPKQAFNPIFALRCYKQDIVTVLLFSFGSEELRVINQEVNTKTYQICQLKNVLRWFNLVIPDNEYIKNILKWKL